MLERSFRNCWIFQIASLFKAAMAAIIAQLTRAARARRDKRTYGTNKCMYTLERFDSNGFDPTIHNKYCVEKARWERQRELNLKEDEKIQRAWKEMKVKTKLVGIKISKILLQLKRTNDYTESEKVSWKNYTFEIFLLIIFFLTIPVLIIIFEIMFFYGTRYIPPDMLEDMW